MDVLTFRFTDDMIMVAKKKRGRDASFFYVSRRCLSDPFTPSVYIEGRSGKCR